MTVGHLIRRRVGDWRRWLLRIVGAVFLVSGVVNLLGLGENIPATFDAMALANAGTRLAPISDWIAANAIAMRTLAAAVMLVTGAVEVVGISAWRVAAAVQFVLLLVFVTLLHRGFPEVVFTDGLCAMALMVALGGARGPREAGP